MLFEYELNFNFINHFWIKIIENLFQWKHAVLFFFCLSFNCKRDSLSGPKLKNRTSDFLLPLRSTSSIQQIPCFKRTWLGLSRDSISQTGIYNSKSATLKMRNLKLQCNGQTQMRTLFMEWSMVDSLIW